jgi:uncharacterized protein (TIGR02757 family)
VRPIELKSRLEKVYETYHRPSYLRYDPLEYVRSMKGRSNREISGLLFSSLAYGRVEQIRATIRDILAVTGPDVHGFAAATTLGQKRKAFCGIRHRFNTGGDIALLMECAARATARRGSLEAVFLEGMEPSHQTVRAALDSFSARLKKVAAETSAVRSPYFEFLLPAPASGSACKRMAMFLRWMARPDDGIDLGEWKRVPASMLVMPLDTHVAAVSRLLGLTRRATAGWTMVEEVTRAMKKVCPEDPVRYDFSLCRAGMIDFRGVTGAS